MGSPHSDQGSDFLVEPKLREGESGIESAEGEADQIAFLVVILVEDFGEKSSEFLGSELNAVSEVVNDRENGDLPVSDAELVRLVKVFGSLLEEASADVVGENQRPTHLIIKSKITLPPDQIKSSWINK